MAKNKILHRALKIENIFINYINKDNNEFIVKLKLTEDCCSVEDSFNLLPERIYVNRRIYAYEVLMEKEYTEFSDLWSLGILIYTLYFRKYPFKGESEEEILKSIKDNLENLKTIDNEDLDDLLKKLLVFEPKKRLTWEEYFEHPFFKTKKSFKIYYEQGKQLGKSDLGFIYEAKVIKPEEKKGEKRAVKVYLKDIVKSYIKDNKDIIKM